MLELKNITKNYEIGENVVKALKGVTLSFRESEFVSILGQSGCGKTTLLNIIGGLDKFTSGDLIINGKSTKDFSDRDWDDYRNHKIGFVFQSYNLISHQTVLSNVELALTLSGVSKQERKQRAIDALNKVGLGDQLDKKPQQMSGGQMQRVAIARALVNNPDILLADEPTGALDSETSVQIMDILKEISKEKLVIMVTHNPDIAEKYSTRIIRLLDGNIVSDSSPCEIEKSNDEKNGKKTKTSMSFFTALSLSFNNLLTKKGRTILTSFAGSIGIIGIALILSVSSGVQAYIDTVQEDTLSSYPIIIESETTDATELLKNLTEAKERKVKHKRDKVYSNPAMYDMLNAMSKAETNKNNLKKFKKYLENNRADFGENLNAIQYSYNLDMNVLVKDTDEKIIKSDVSELMNQLYGISSTETENTNNMSNSFMQGFNTMNVWEEMLSGDDGRLYNSVLEEQYDLIYGNWPKKHNEIMLIVDENNEISDLCLYALGLESAEDMKKVMEAFINGEEIKTKTKSWSYKQICDMDFRLVLSSDCYSYDSEAKTYKNLTESEDGLDYLYDNGKKLKVAGILRPNETATSSMISGAIAYTSALTEYIIEEANNNDLVKKQLENKDTDVFTGLKFKTGNEVEPTDEEKAKDIKAHFKGLSVIDKASTYTSITSTPTDEYVEEQVKAITSGKTKDELIALMLKNADSVDMDKDTLKKYLESMEDEKFQEYSHNLFAEGVKMRYAKGIEEQLSAYPNSQLAAMFDASVAAYTLEELAKLYDEYMPPRYSEATLEDNMFKLGYVDINTPKTISLFSSTFQSKDEIADVIDSYNDKSKEDDKIAYTDYIALLMSSVTTIINAISYVLIAFVAISLVVSSIMIGIITYISVLERTKEIGILRAIGASKKDVSNVFNAETLIIGFTSGAFGIGITLLLNLVINIILHALTGIEILNASLPPVGAVILVVISMLLTFIAGLIPSKMAAKKDPVIALRTE